ncbi:MAG: RIP metalloprotease RseP [Clostridiales bacterium]|nr:RIP metalloprotease RseP [Clostridiales bacterium]
MSALGIVAAVFMLGLLVTVHELGHFWVACLLKIRAFEVSIFVGPKLVDWRKNNVEYSIRALPFGAYVRFTDYDENGEVIVSDDPDLLYNSPRWKRLIVALAGPFMNLVLGVLIFILLYSFAGYPTTQIGGYFYGSQFEQAITTTETPFEFGDTIVAVNGHRVYSYLDYNLRINDESQLDPVTLTMRSQTTDELYDIVLEPMVEQRPMIGVLQASGISEKYNGFEVYEVYDAQNEGHPVLRVGDYLTKVNGKSVADEDFSEFMQQFEAGDVLTLTYFRNGEEFTDECIYTLMTSTNDRGPKVCSYTVDDLGTFAGAVKNALYMPYTIISGSVILIGDVFEGQEEVYNMVAGPVGMTSVVSEVVDNVDYSISEKLADFGFIVGIISIGLVFSNLLPIPGLDGIQIILILVELIIGHALSKKSENILNICGFVLLIGLALFAFASDIIRIIVE